MKKNVLYPPFFLVMVVALFSCASASTVSEIRINGVEMPNEVQVNIIFADQSSKQNPQYIKIFWYYARVYNKNIYAQGISELVLEKQPLDWKVPKSLPSDTAEVGIHIFISNPSFLRFRIVVLDPITKKENSLYEGIRDNYELMVNGPVAVNRQFEVCARVDLIGKDGNFVIDSAEIGDLVYSIKSP